MANVNKGGIVAAAQQNAAATAKAQGTLGVMVNSKSVQERFEKMLGKKAPAFLITSGVSDLITEYTDEGIPTNIRPSFPAGA